MPSEFRPLGEFVSLVSGNTPSKANAAYWGGTTSWISAKDMGDFWIEDAEDHLTPAGVAVASRLVPAGTVLMLTRGMTLHKRVPICRVTKPSTFNQDVKAVLPKQGVSARFVPYLLFGNHDRLHERVDSAGHGTGRLNTEAITSFPVYVPSRPEQETIADFGEALDERLRSLRQTNTTLETIAQTLFKSWFVDFDPVRAKAEGREPDGMDAATAALFPDSFEDSPLGPIPQGWHAASLSDCMELNPQRVLRKGSLASYLDMANAPTQGHRPAEITQRELGSGSKFINGDTLLAKITPCLENGKTAFVDFLADNEVGWGSTEFIVMRPKAPLPPFFGYLLARMPNFRAFAIQAMTGTSGRQRVELGRLKQFSVAVPDDGVAEAFGKIIEPLRSRIAAASSHADNLSKLRDTLLPRLISGKLRLPEVSGLIEEAIA